MSIVTLGELGIEVNLVAYQDTGFGPYTFNLTDSDGNVLSLDDVEDVLCQVRSSWESNTKLFDITASVDTVNKSITLLATPDTLQAVSLPVSQRRQSHGNALVYGLRATMSGRIRPLMHGAFYLYPSLCILS